VNCLPVVIGTLQPHYLLQSLLGFVNLKQNGLMDLGKNHSRKLCLKKAAAKKLFPNRKILGVLGVWMGRLQCIFINGRFMPWIKFDKCFCIRFKPFINTLVEPIFEKNREEKKINRLIIISRFSPLTQLSQYIAWMSWISLCYS
jgi:hypothetical protein